MSNEEFQKMENITNKIINKRIREKKNENSFLYKLYSKIFKKDTNQDIEFYDIDYSKTKIQ